MRQLFYISLACLVFIVATLTLLLTTRSAQANGPWYVRTDGADSHDCRTPATPCFTVNAVLDKPEFQAGDTILVATGTYTATDGPPVLLDKDAIVSGGWNDTFSAKGERSVFSGDYEQSVLVVTEGVTARVSDAQTTRGGRKDYALHNEGTLVLERVRVARNSEYGIGNSGTLTLTGSVVEYNYGGVVNGGTLMMLDSTVRLNGGRRFGAGCRGFLNGRYSTATLINSAIYGNRTGDAGPGGGMCNYGRATLINSTVSFNAAPYAGGADELGLGGGGIYNITDEYLVLYNSTVSHNVAVIGGGIYNKAGSVFLYNSIVADNEIITDTRYPTESADCAGVIISRDYNLLGDSTDCDWHAGIGDLLNVEAGLFSISVDVPAFTPLLPFSPAINAGDPTGCKGPEGEPLSTDQRGIPRVGRCDIGAYEYSLEHDPLFYSLLPFMHRD
jgi:hypothetical protein